MDKKQFFTLVLMLLLLAGCTTKLETDKTTSKPIQKESPEPLPTLAHTGVTILAEGVVQPAQPALPMAFESSGRVLAIHVQVGDQVQEGELLAQLEEPEPLGPFEAAVTAAELTVLRAQQSLDELQANAEIRRTNTLNEIATHAQAVRDAQYQLENFNLPTYLQGLEVIEALDLMQAQLDAASEAFEPYRYFSADNPTRQTRLEALHEAQSQYDAAVKHLRYQYALQAAQANLNKARRDYENFASGSPTDEVVIADAELANAQAQLALAQDDLDEAITAQEQVFLVAPWAGTVMSVEAVPGALVGSGTPVVTLLDTSQMEFYTTNLSERDLAQVTAGQRAIVTLKAYPDVPLEATVTRIGWQVGEVVGDAATFPVVLTLKGSDLLIRPGMTGRVEILGEE